MTLIKNFTLKADQPFSSCSPSRSCTGEVSKTSTERTGELYLAIDALTQKPTEAVFYARSRNDCTDERSVSSCDLSASFRANELDQLMADSPELKQYLANSASNPNANTNNPVDGVNTEQPADDGPLALFTDVVGGNIVPIGALAVVLLVVLLRKRIVRLVSPSQSRQRPSQRQRSESVSFQSQGLNPIFNASLESSSELNRQLLPLIQKVELLATRLDRLETEITVISQKSQPSVSFSTPATQQTPRPSQPVITNSVPKPRPALDVDLIKLAVATSDYELIKTFAHDFVTETLESRQGMEDGLRFSIDGNQDQSDQRSQSEFIAIPYLDETYLIPNLLPNAADPARTIRRFVERNKLYRGSGDNLLSISVLATVERSGDSYILRNSGRVG